MFQGLAFGEMWTAIYVLVALGLVAEQWAAALRRKASSKRVRSSLLVALVSLVAACSYLHIHPWNLWSPGTRRLAGLLAKDALPPRLPNNGWREILGAARATFQMSFLAILIAVLLGIPLALGGARNFRVTRRSNAAVVRQQLMRMFALVTRVIPPTVWALLVLFVVLPGIFAGALALALYTIGVLARLFGDIAETADFQQADHAVRLGALRPAAWLYGSLPDIAPKWTAYALYRWEVAARESVVVGIVGAGGLGQLLSTQTNGRFFHQMTGTLIAVIALTIVVDAVSASARRSLR